MKTLGFLINQWVLNKQKMEANYNKMKNDNDNDNKKFYHVRIN